LIAYLGHDDLWLPHHLEVMIDALEATQCDMAHSLVANVGADGELWAATPWPERGGWIPPSCTVHRRSVTEAIGGWRHYKELAVAPEIDLWRRARKAGFRFTFVPRLSVVKIGASARPGVYQSRPCHEQAAWSARIASEPDFEATQLARLIASATVTARIPSRELVRELLMRIRSSPIGFFTRRKGAAIDRVRSFKGL
jgi:GT2 family glycosyltransferase